MHILRPGVLISGMKTGNEFIHLSLSFSGWLPGHAVLQFWLGHVPEGRISAERGMAEVRALSLSRCFVLLALLFFRFCRESYDIGRGCPNVGAIKQVG